MIGIMASQGRLIFGALYRPYYGTNFSKYTRSFSRRKIQNCSSVSKKDVMPVKYKVLYDGDCPLCVREVNMLKKINRRPGMMNFVNIQDGQYKPEIHNGITYEEAMGLLHVIGPDKKVYIGMEASRELYNSIGWGWMMAWTKLPGMKTITDKAYEWFANNRYRMTGRENPCDDPNRCKITGLKDNQKTKTHT